jgi:hypothetical protein
MIGNMLGEPAPSPLALEAQLSKRTATLEVEEQQPVVPSLVEANFKPPRFVVRSFIPPIIIVCICVKRPSALPSISCKLEDAT